MEPNPFAPPKASLSPASPGGIWRDGRILVLTPGSALPPRCVKCNAPAVQPQKNRTVYWHQPWIYLLILANVLIYLIVALIVRKKAVVAPGLCPAHRRRHWTGLAVGWSSLPLFFVLAIVSAATDECLWMILGLVAFLAALVTGIILSRIVLADRIDGDFVRLKGCGQAFLDSFPDFHG